MNDEEILHGNPNKINKDGRIIAAIDIGTTKIVAIIGAVSDAGKVKVLGMGKSASQGVKRGVVLNIEEAAASIQEAVEQAEKESGYKFHDVYVGIAGQHIKSMKNRHSKYIQSKDSEITQSDINELLDDMHNIALDAGEEIIHVIPQSYTVDNESGVKQPIGMFGKRLEANFHIVVGEIASAKHIRKCIERAGLKVNKMILEPLASSSAVLSGDEKEIGVAMVDIGGGTTDLAIYYDGILRHTAVIALGGYVITKDIKDACGILQRQAEQLKVQFGTALGEAAPEDIVSVKGISGREPKRISIKFLSQVIQARMEEIIDHVVFEIENSGYIDKIGAGVTITGGGALLKHLRQLMSYKTSMDVNVGYPSRRLSAENQDVSLPMYSTGIGLLLSGYEIEKENNNKKTEEKPKNVEEQLEDKLDELDTEEYENNNLLSTIKEKISGMFDDKSLKM
ncbi:MAG: cell division protein FtsA [Bacteroidetes bacterium 4572_117]|nr:MAG: cell division protein FtsA [Bacteroidetes bacterium 4572_117]